MAGGWLGVGGLGVGGSGVRALGVGIEWVSSATVARRGRRRSTLPSLREVVACQRFLERAAEIYLWAPNRAWVRHQTGE
jgi:hypothetical protein